VLEVDGRFDVAHAYIPNYDEQCAKLASASGDRHPQELAHAYIRHTVAFAQARFEVQLEGLTSAVVQSPVRDTLREALAQHREAVAQDPRVYRQLAFEPYTGRSRCSVEWSTAIAHQAALDAAVHREMFASNSGPLPYDLQLQCQVSPAAEHPRESVPGQPPDLGEREFLVEISLINRTTREVAQRYRLANPYAMDANLRVRVLAGEHQRMRSRASPESGHVQQESDGYGIHCALVRAPDGALLTDFLPTYEQPQVGEPQPAEVGMREALRLDRLMRDPLPILDDLLQAMRTYSRERQDEIAGLKECGSSTAELASELADFAKQVRCATRGVQLLREKPQVLRAFKLANEAMLQAFEVQKKRFDSWHLFQIVILLAQIPHLARRAGLVRTKKAAQDEEENEEEIVDVLLSATGSGKTEAYQAVVVFLMFLERITGRKYGVTAWLRFPQRSLSAEQAQRLAYITAAAERLRVRERLGGFPYAIGVYVGRSTPGHISSLKDYAADDYLPKLIERAKKDKRVLERLRFVDPCPHCGGAVKIDLVAEHFRIQHVCCNEACWSNQPVPPEEAHLRLCGELGIYVSDEEIYRLQPSILLGTVDKAVVLGHSGRFRIFFRATHFCKHHGFLTHRTCRHLSVDKIGDDWSNPVKCFENPNISTRPLKLARQPDPGIPIMVIDEMHQEAEELGSLDAHYISTLDEVQRSYPRGRAPKFIVSTATTNGVDHHIHHLCLRRARCFRARGTRNSFFSRIRLDPQTGEPLVRRTYLGALPIGLSRVGVAEWAYKANKLYHELLTECEAALIDEPERMCQALGIEVTQAAAALEHLRTMLSLSVLFVRRMRDAGCLESCFNGDDRQLPASERAARRFLRFDRHTPVAAMRRTMAQIQANDETYRGCSLIATSVIASGVHVAQINMMCLVGRPLTNAEYIQTSSRCGREEPGIVLVALDWRQLFERSAYNDFLDFHHDLERQVESVSINRYAPRVLRRMVVGVLRALILNGALRQLRRRRTHRADGLREALRQPKVADLLAQQILRAYGFDRAEALGVFNSRQLREAKEYVLAEARRQIISLQQPPLPPEKDPAVETADPVPEDKPLSSVRGIEPQVRIKPATTADKKVLEALRAAATSEGVSRLHGATGVEFEVPYGRLLYEDHLPGGVVLLPGHLYAKVMGAESDPKLAHLVGPDLMDGVISEAERGFEEDGGQIDVRLPEARATEKLAVCIPRTLFVSPWPVRLVCTSRKCLLLEEPQYTSHAAQVSALADRIRGEDPHTYIGCRACGAPLRQLPYVSVHVCGHIAPIELPLAARGRQVSVFDPGDLRGVRFKDFHSGKDLGGVLPTACPKCRPPKDEEGSDPRQDPYAGYPDHQRPQRRARQRDPRCDGAAMVMSDVRGGRAQTFFPRLEKFVGLTAATATSLKRFRAASSAEEMGRAVVCGVLDLQSPRELRANLKDGAGQRLPPTKTASLQKEFEQLDENYQRMRALPGLAKALTYIEERLAALQAQIQNGQGRFVAGEPYLSDVALLAQIGSHQRAIEAAFLKEEFRERSWTTEMAKASLSEQLLLQDQRETLLSGYDVREVRYLENLTMVTAAVGFTRQAAEPTSSRSGVPLRFNAFHDAFAKSEQEMSTYVQPACPEGIWLRLNPVDLVRWGVDNLGWTPPVEVLNDSRQAHIYVLQMAPLLAGSPAQILQRAQQGPDSQQSRDAVHLLGLMHTSVHALMRAASQSSGYNALSFTDHLLPADLSAIIHISPRKAFVTGGLQSLFDHDLGTWFDAAAERSRTCTPVCSHRGGSCNACLQTPLGCESHNAGISRAYLHGGLVPSYLPGEPLRVRRGFWS